jgi:indole-3-glycerol phosphate synthase
MINIEKETADRLEKKGISKEVTDKLFSFGLITYQSAKRFLIIDEYKKESPPHGERDHTKDRIADDYCVSSETVKKYIAKAI